MDLVFRRVYGLGQQVSDSTCIFVQILTGFNLIGSYLSAVSSLRFQNQNKSLCSNITTKYNLLEETKTSMGYQEKSTCQTRRYNDNDGVHRTYAAGTHSCHPSLISPLRQPPIGALWSALNVPSGVWAF